MPSDLVSPIKIIKADGKSEPFNPEKLRRSLKRSGAAESSIERVMLEIESDLYDGMTTRDIYERAFSILHNLEKPVASRYSLRKAVMELGPTGGAFEDLVSEVLKSRGFETLTRQVVLGECVPHEIDVVAWNDEKLIMCEAKYHNQLGIKSDVKVALYIKARFDDLKGNLFLYGNKKRHLDEGWLITNTKFSSTAIHYGVCKKLIMIGWNYPEHGNLQQMIEEGGLHPITCLESLTKKDKELLLSQGIILCKSIKDDPGILERVLGSRIDSKAIQEEINQL
jgi:hypothetical protein